VRDRRRRADANVRPDRHAVLPQAGRHRREIRPRGGPGTVLELIDEGHRAPVDPYRARRRLDHQEMDHAAGAAGQVAHPRQGALPERTGRTLPARRRAAKLS
jgi:hypothetical protein